MGLGQRIRAWFGGESTSFDPPAQVRFAAPVYPVDQLSILRLLRARNIGREEALGVPAVLRGRNLICSASTLPLQAVNADNVVSAHPLFQQIDPNVENVTTLAMTIEDLLFEGVAWWRVVGRQSNGYPAKAQRYEPATVSLTPPHDYRAGMLPYGGPTVATTGEQVGISGAVVWMGGEPVSFADVIRFSSPNPPLLVAAQRAIQRAIRLDEAADLYASNTRMRGFFTPADPNVDPAGDEEIEEMLTDFANSRAKRLDGYVPAALTYNPVQDPTPAELQLIAQQQRADLAIANAMGIDPEDLGINTTSRTYQNATDRRQDRVNDVMSPYMGSITGRLSMPDVTKRGTKARFWLDEYMRADPKTRAEVQQTYVDMGVTDRKEVRHAEGLPGAPPAPPKPALQAGPRVPNTQVSAIPEGAR